MSCPECFSGAVHEATPMGTTTKAYGLDAYVVEPPASSGPAKGVVVMIPDAFGWDFVNCRLLCDVYAVKGGYKVYLPDFMDGHSAPLYMLEGVKNLSSKEAGIFSKVASGFWVAYAAIPWFLKNRPGRVWPRVQGFFEQLRKEEGQDLSVGAVGLCWGGKFAVMLAHGQQQQGEGEAGRPLIDAAFTAHPSLLSFYSDIEKIALPVSFAIGDKDNVTTLKHAKRIKELVEAKEGAARGECVIYEGAGHGFSVRADSSLEQSARQAEESDAQCIAWFNKHFKPVA